MTNEPRIRITHRVENQVARFGTTRAWRIEGFMVIDGKEQNALTTFEVPFKVWKSLRCGQVYTIRLHTVKR